MLFHDFLVEHAKFPFPPTDEPQSVDATEPSNFEIGLLQREWKATHAVRDEGLISKLCDGLKNILGDTPISARAEKSLLARFSPQVQSGDEYFGEDTVWLENSSEATSRMLLDTGVRKAAIDCLFVYGRHHFKVNLESSVEGGTSRVDYLLLVDNKKVALCEAKSPSVMQRVGKILPEHGIKLTWFHGQSLIPKILTNAALFLGLRQMEWLFLTCHNYWIVCCLVRNNNQPFLAYSPIISMEDSSAPFRAYLGAILSVLKGVHIKPSTFNENLKLDTTIDSNKNSTTKPLMTHSCAHAARYDNVKPGLTVCPSIGTYLLHGWLTTSQITSSSPSSPEDFQVLVHLQAFSNNTLALPVPDRNAQQCLWLTHLIGSGSTGNVWQGHFDNSNDLFAVKIVESLHPSDMDRQQRLHNEFNAYLKIEAAYQSGQLSDRITPRCYGAFGGDGINVVVLDLCNSNLKTWDELSTSELAQVYKLVQDLHGIGIRHGDLEPWNVMRAPGGGFCLIDFSESRKHTCNENMVESCHDIHPPQKKICYELQMLRNCLWTKRG